MRTLISIAVFAVMTAPVSADSWPALVPAPLVTAIPGISAEVSVSSAAIGIQPLFRATVRNATSGMVVETSSIEPVDTLMRDGNRVTDVNPTGIACARAGIPEDADELLRRAQAAVVSLSPGQKHVVESRTVLCSFRMLYPGMYSGVVDVMVSVRQGAGVEAPRRVSLAISFSFKI